MQTAQIFPPISAIEYYVSVNPADLNHNFRHRSAAVHSYVAYPDLANLRPITSTRSTAAAVGTESHCRFWAHQHATFDPNLPCRILQPCLCILPHVAVSNLRASVDEVNICTKRIKRNDGTSRILILMIGELNLQA